MAKLVSLIGTPDSGKAYFLAALTIALEEKGLGRIEPLHPGFGFIMDSSFTREPSPLSSATSSYVGQILYGKRKKIDIIEKTFSKGSFSSNAGLISDAIANCQCAVIFFNSGRQPRSDDSFNPSVLNGNIRLLIQPLLKQFKPWWKFRRKVKKLIFVATGISPDEVPASEFASTASIAMKQGLDHVVKRKVPFSFYTMDTLKPTGGIEYTSIESILSDILEIAL